MSGWVVVRVSTVAALACAALALALPSASGRPVAVRGKIFCGPFPDSSTHWEAVLGHRTSIAQAVLFRRQLEAKAIKGIQFERDYCDDIEFQIPGPDTRAVRDAFFQQAVRSGVAVSFEAPDNQKQNASGEVTAVFGHRPTLARASDLLAEVARKGWREADLVRVSTHDWKIVLRHVPQTGEANFAAEAKGGGYPVTFEK